MIFKNSLNLALDKLLSENSNVILYGEDVEDPYGGAFKVTKGLSTKYPNQIISTPISEASLIGMSAGMAMSGLLPIVEIMFGDFLGITVDQLLNHLVKYKWVYKLADPIPVMVRTAMGGRRGYGPTHSQSLEPLLATIPGITIISPSHYHDPGEILLNSVLQDGSIKIFSEYKLLYSKSLVSSYNISDGISLRHSNNSIYPTAYLSNCDFNLPEVTIITFGGNALLAEEVLVDLLIEYEIDVEVILPSIIKPFPYKDILERIEEVEYICFIEESSKTHGWSSEIVSHLFENDLLVGKKLIRVGAKDFPIPSSIILEKKVLPQKSEIIALILEKMKSN
jgi:pyruvate/2-oxoglutarate/acetoin dehydrogenase E1 component